MTEPKDPGTEEQSLPELRGLSKPAAPDGFGQKVENTIAKRSGGRFFGRRSLPERLPLLALAIVALVLALLVTLFLRGSETGALEAPSTAPQEDASR